jgi:hypothetical protein
MAKDKGAPIQTLYVGFVVLFRSITAIGVSLDSENYVTPGKGSLLALGILGLNHANHAACMALSSTSSSFANSPSMNLMSSGVSAK